MEINSSITLSPPFEGGDGRSTLIVNVLQSMLAAGVVDFLSDPFLFFKNFTYNTFYIFRFLEYKSVFKP
ncbi:MAG: hypothetical protein A2X03_13285 [Bacteroidetes bacterium GWA2_40_15]|nr:MAG: hypothetical protein A2X03_13285 [Bacteroidetes bacterium GWA2_40_15]OFX93291.1 MAG: hypothetical protein A2X06_01940 [Bacteroidetes bacterium GWC2_40_22]HAM08689.1 hypothetical protein [Bacteroidales bacterium]HBH83233.1 hypothetical protein [Bacteroidales bacterium]HBQ83807.1 hypothetical protein [Bacteroidales bacterium]